MDKPVHIHQTAEAPVARSSIRSWFDGHYAVDAADDDDERCEWARVVPFIVVHLACGLAWYTGVSPVALGVCLALFAVRMFAITAFYHRYFSHRTFQTSRVFAFLGAALANSSAQRGPLWWAAHHRAHHKHSDEDPDLHSPLKRGFWHAHVLWFLTRGSFRTRTELVPDLVKQRELVWLDRFDWVAPVVLLFACLGLGWALGTWYPELGTSALQMGVWGFCISTVLLFHATFTVNSLAHAWGSRRFNTGDDSRNNLVLALLTFGEGWHNNHHHYPSSARQGFRWYEIDLTWYGLLLLQCLGLVRKVRGVPERVLAQAEGALQ